VWCSGVFVREKMPNFSVKGKREICNLWSVVVVFVVHVREKGGLRESLLLNFQYRRLGGLDCFPTCKS
jgi:hypothetical protein